MDWLSENWTWIVLLAGGYFLISRMGIGRAMGHSYGHNHAAGHDHRDEEYDHPGDASEAFDPVSLNPVPTATGFASIHHGQVYQFEDRVNRDAFEAEPEKYLSSLPISAQHAEAANHPKHHAHKGHGCC